jgi:hypothetical protein
MTSADEIQSLKNEVATLMLIVGFLARKADISIADLNDFADKAMASLPDDRKAAVRDSLDRLAKAYEAYA